MPVLHNFFSRYRPCVRVCSAYFLTVFALYFERRTTMRRFVVAALLAMLMLVLAVSQVFAVSPHFNFANVTSVTSNSITVSFKEAGLGNSLNSVNITLSGTAECINPGSHHPKAANKESVSASGTFNVSN